MVSVVSDRNQMRRPPSVDLLGSTTSKDNFRGNSPDLILGKQDLIFNCHADFFPYISVLSLIDQQSRSIPLSKKPQSRPFSNGIREATLVTDLSKLKPMQRSDAAVSPGDVACTEVS